MPDFPPVPQRRQSDFDRVVSRLRTRTWPIGVSALYVVLGLAYFFRWGPVGQHTSSLWISPTDLWFTYFAASQLAHGHFGAIYETHANFLEFPGILILLAPLGALSNSFHTSLLEVTKNQVIPAHNFAASAPNIPFLNAQEFHFQGQLYVSHPQWITAVDPYALLMSCTALFACDRARRTPPGLPPAASRSLRRRGGFAVECHGVVGASRGCGGRRIGGLCPHLRT